MKYYLKPCPYCGSDPEVHIKDSYNPQDVSQIRIRCSREGCMGRNNKWLTDELDAITRWNKRP